MDSTEDLAHQGGLGKYKYPVEHARCFIIVGHFRSLELLTAAMLS